MLLSYYGGFYRLTHTRVDSLNKSIIEYEQSMFIYDLTFTIFYFCVTIFLAIKRNHKYKQNSINTKISNKYQATMDMNTERKCSACGSEIYLDNSFCANCGSPLPKIQFKSDIVGNNSLGNNEGETTYPVSYNQKPISSNDIKKPITSKESINKNSKSVIIALLSLCIITCLLLAILFTQKSDMKKQYEDLLSQYTKQQDKLSSVSSTANKYTNIVYALSANSTTGFSANEYIFTMTEGKTKEFQLTTSFSQPVMVTFDSYGDAAHLDFHDDSWSTLTNVKITADKEGISWFRFKNDVDDKEFIIVVIVNKSVMIDPEITEAMKNFSLNK